MALCIWAANVRYFYADWSKTVNLKFMIFFFILHPLIFVSVLATDHLLRSGRLPYVHQCKHCRQGKPPTQMYCGDGSEVLDMMVVDGIQCFGLNVEAVILTQIKHQAANGGRVKQRDVSNRVGAKCTGMRDVVMDCNGQNGHQIWTSQGKEEASTEMLVCLSGLPAPQVL